MTAVSLRVGDVLHETDAIEEIPCAILKRLYIVSCEGQEEGVRSSRWAHRYLGVHGLDFGVALCLIICYLHLCARFSKGASISK
jgi:hypothetical protein